MTSSICRQAVRYYDGLALQFCRTQIYKIIQAFPCSQQTVKMGAPVCLKKTKNRLYVGTPR